MNWKANKGVQLSVTTSVNASARLHWHFDPLVGGGFGDDVTITGSVVVPATGQLGLSLAEVGAKPAALMTLSMACINAPLSLETGSAIKLGARTGLRLFDSNIPPVAILDSGTQRVFFDKAKPSEATKLSNAKADKPSILVMWVIRPPCWR